MKERSTAGLRGLGRPIVLRPAVLAVLMLAKFLIVKPPAFLIVGLLFVLSAYLLMKGRHMGVLLLLVLCILSAVMFGAHLVDKGFDLTAYQHVTDFVVTALGFMVALGALAGAVTALRDE
jgi:hypothetical protein